jgi:CcmD family protein
MGNDSLGGFDPTFVFLVFSIVWMVVFGYVFYVARRQSEVRNDLEDLKRELGQRTTAPDTDTGTSAGPEEHA